MSKNQIQTFLVRANEKGAITDLIHNQGGFRMTVELHKGQLEGQFSRWKVPLDTKEIDSSVLLMLSKEIDTSVMGNINLLECTLTMGCVSDKGWGYSCALFTQEGGNNSFILTLPEKGWFYENVVVYLRGITKTASMVEKK
jgi:hypothetical protein